MEFEGFDWDVGNFEKCRKHGVEIEDIEETLRNDPFIGQDETHSTQEERLRAVGKTGAGRSLFIVFTVRLIGGERLVRPISARFMHAAEVRHYERATARSQTIPRADKR